MSIPSHHKEIAKHLRERIGEPVSVANFRDDNGQRPIAVGTFGSSKSRLYSTIGICDRSLPIPAGRFELAAVGASPWLPNALVSSVYWLHGRTIETWPMVCEGAVKQNSKSTYRHMGYIPSEYQCNVSEGQAVRWLLGVPLKDSEVSIGLEALRQKVLGAYPNWLLIDTQPTLQADAAAQRGLS